MKSQSILNKQSPDTSVHRASSVKVAYGDNAVAGICGVGVSSKGRNASLLVSEIAKRIFRDFPSASADGRRIVESIVWPFVARVSKRDPWFTDRDYDRFYKSARRMAARVLSHDKPGSIAQKYVKFWCDRFLQVGMHDVEECPSHPEFERSPIFSGYMLRFVKRAIARHDLAFLYSLQKGSKRMWIALDVVCERASLEKHKERLTLVKPPTDRWMLQRIRNVSTRIFNGPIDDTKFMPSGSACLQASVKDGGALSLFEPFQPDQSVGLVSLNASLHGWRVQQHASALESVRTVASYDATRLCDVQVVTIAEPGKFRIITKGDGMLYSALQPIQGHMLASWKRSIASTMKDEDLTSKIDRILRPVAIATSSQEYEAVTAAARWVQSRWDLVASVDYEAATDLLNKDATLAAGEGLKKHPLYELLRLSFGRGRATYDVPTDLMKTKKDKKTGVVTTSRIYRTETVQFDEGQLMGHPCSFPKLCVINQSVWEESLWRYLLSLGDVFDSEDQLHGVFRELRSLVIVNGDDMLFSCDRELFEIFRGISASVGFKFSAGKNYLSSDSCLINSQIYKIANDAGKRRAIRCGYLNMKLVTGHNLKKGSEDAEALPTQLGRELAKMVKLCPWTSCAIAYAFGRFKTVDHGFRPNWFMPVALGGFGYTEDGIVPRYTREQRNVAAAFVVNGDMSLYRKTGVTSRLLKKYRGAMGTWTWADLEGPLEWHIGEDADPWLGRLTYAARAMAAGTAVANAGFVPVIVRKDHRLKPISLEAIERYRNMRRVRVHGPGVPPLLGIRNRAGWAVSMSELTFFCTRSNVYRETDSLFSAINRSFWNDLENNVEETKSRERLGNFAVAF